MTREEAIAILQAKYSECKSFYDLAKFPEISYPGTVKYLQAIELALSALTPPTQEQMERVWPYCEYCKPGCGNCFNCGAWDKYGEPCVCEECVDASNHKPDCNYCDNCGRPLTPEAWEEMIKRWEALYENIHNT